MGKVLLCLFALLLPLGLNAQVHAATVTLVSTDTDGVRLGLHTGPYQLEDAGNGYQRITLVGFESTATPGAPKLPLKGSLIAVPAGTHVVIDSVGGDYVTLSDIRLSPVPTVRRSLGVNGEVTTSRLLESASYQQDQLIPVSAVTLGFEGSMRGQGVAQLLFHPVQYNPVSGEVRIYSSIQVRVRFMPDGRGKATRSLSKETRRDDGFKAIMENSLINYTGAAQ